MDKMSYIVSLRATDDKTEEVTVAATKIDFDALRSGFMSFKDGDATVLFARMDRVLYVKYAGEA